MRQLRQISEDEFEEYETTEKVYREFTIPKLEAEIARLQKLLADAKALKETK